MTLEQIKEIQSKIAALHVVINEARKTIVALEGALPPSIVVGEMQAIIKNVSAEFGISVEAMKGPSRARPTFLARAEAMRRIRQTNRYSLPQIGRFFGGRNHASVQDAIRRAEKVARAREKSLRD